MAFISYVYQDFVTALKHASGAGVITPTGSFSWVFAITPGGTITPSGSLATLKNADDIGVVTGGITPVGNLGEIIIGLGDNQCEGFITPVGTYTVGISVYVMSADGSIVPTGALNLQTNKTLAGAITPTGSLLVTALRVDASGGITPVGSLLGGAPVKLGVVLGGYQDPVFIGILVTVLD